MRVGFFLPNRIYQDLVKLLFFFLKKHCPNTSRLFESHQSHLSFNIMDTFVNTCFVFLSGANYFAQYRLVLVLSLIVVISVVLWFPILVVPSTFPLSTIFAIRLLAMRNTCPCHLCCMAFSSCARVFKC